MCDWREQVLKEFTPQIDMAMVAIATGLGYSLPSIHILRGLLRLLTMAALVLMLTIGRE